MCTDTYHRKCKRKPKPKTVREFHSHKRYHQLRSKHLFGNALEGSCHLGFIASRAVQRLR